MKTEWVARTYSRYPGWEVRRIVSGGYTLNSTRAIQVLVHTTKGNTWRTQRVPVRVPQLVRYEITYNGAYFFSVPRRADALRIIKKYAHMELFNYVR